MTPRSHTLIRLFNHNHGEHGRFASVGSAGSTALNILELPVRAEHAVIGKLKSVAAAVVNKFGSSTTANPALGALAHGLKTVGGVAGKAYLATWIAGRSAVASVARAKGLSELETKRLTAICSCYDALNCKAVFLGLEHAGLPGLAGASLFIPTASVAYLAYSTASNPLAVMRAAKTTVMNAKRGFQEATEMARNALVENSVGILADALKRHAGDDTFFAILPLAMEQTNNAAAAVQLAERAYKGT